MILKRAEHFTRESVEREYTRLDYKLGWRFLYSSELTLKTAQFAFIGLNPGGNKPESDHPDWSSEVGSAYVTESWDGYPKGESPLQRQVISMFKLANVEPENVLAGNFVPFRSPDWKSLPNRDQALAFGDQLWRWVFSQGQIKRLVVMGVSAGNLPKRLANILSMTVSESLPVIWGQYKMTKYHSRDGRVMLVLPHLSRFQIFGRDNGFDQSFSKALV